MLCLLEFIEIWPPWHINCFSPPNYLRHKGGDIQVGGLPMDTTSKLAGFYSTLFFSCWASSRESVNTIFSLWYDLAKESNSGLPTMKQSNYHSITLTTAPVKADGNSGEFSFISYPAVSFKKSFCRKNKNLSSDQLRSYQFYRDKIFLPRARESVVKCFNEKDQCYNKDGLNLSSTALPVYSEINLLSKPEAVVGLFWQFTRTKFWSQSLF